MTAGKAILMNDVVDDVLHGPHLGVHQHVGLAIERSAHGEEFLDFFLWIGFVEERPMRVTADALENRLG